ncbi:hypothetical protein Bca4012_025260 [Brassica carinata]|uniref:DUF4408 domain-containing protein n=1 Tax=Brassica carinata TaxID=52824 RepID=A0A8X7VGF8_BRACI|nr:hypothetical protein Bca52824_022303 [Brassica carinata]
MELVSTAASWFTPTTLFLLLNLMIGTIVITSRIGSSGSRKHHPHHDGFGSGHAPSPLARAPSIIDRVKSINFHLYKFPHPETELFSTTTHHHDVIGSDLPVYPDPNQAPLQRAPSLLDRVKSINMSSYFKFPHDVTGSDPHSHSHPDPTPLQRAPSLLDRVRSINMSHFKFPQYNPEENDSATHTEPTRFENVSTRKSRVEPIDISKFRIPEEDQPTGSRFDNQINPPGFTRAPSILERVKSIKLSSFYRSDPDTQNPDTDSFNQEDHKPVRSKSESKKPVKKKKKATGKMTKSASEKSGFGLVGNSEEAESVESVERRRPETTRVERSTSFGDGEDGVDAKASDFINKFKQQLKLQRLDSILRNKEMLKAN